MALGTFCFRLRTEALNFLKSMAALGAAIRIKGQGFCLQDEINFCIYCTGKLKNLSSGHSIRVQPETAVNSRRKTAVTS